MGMQGSSSGSNPNNGDAHIPIIPRQIFTSIFPYVDHLLGDDQTEENLLRRCGWVSAAGDDEPAARQAILNGEGAEGAQRKGRQEWREVV